MVETRLHHEAIGRSVVRRRILALLGGGGLTRLHLREIARRVETSAGTARRELLKLVEAGLLDRQHEGRQTYYRMRGRARARRSAPDLESLAIARETASRLRELYGSRLRGVYLYGSRARSDHEPDSDLDVFVVLDGVASRLEEIDRTSPIAAEVSLRHGVVITLSFGGEAEWREPSKPFLVSAAADAVPV